MLSCDVSCVFNQVVDGGNIINCDANTVEDGVDIATEDIKIKCVQCLFLYHKLLYTRIKLVISHTKQCIFGYLNSSGIGYPVLLSNEKKKRNQICGPSAPLGSTKLPSLAVN